MTDQFTPTYPRVVTASSWQREASELRDAASRLSYRLRVGQQVAAVEEDLAELFQASGDLASALRFALQPLLRYADEARSTATEAARGNRDVQNAVESLAATWALVSATNTRGAA